MTEFEKEIAVTELEHSVNMLTRIASKLVNNGDYKTFCKLNGATGTILDAIDEIKKVSTDE